MDHPGAAGPVVQGGNDAWRKFSAMNGDSEPGHHVPLALLLEGELDIPALVRACADVIGRHPALACAIEEVDGIPLPTRAATDPPVRFCDLSGAAPDDLDRLVRHEIVRGFDLEAGPLSRFTLVVAGPRRYVLLFVAHRLVFDDADREALAEEVSACYRARAENHPGIRLSNMDIDVRVGSEVAG